MFEEILAWLFMVVSSFMSNYNQHPSWPETEVSTPYRQNIKKHKYIPFSYLCTRINLHRYDRMVNSHTTLTGVMRLWFMYIYMFGRCLKQMGRLSYLHEKLRKMESPTVHQVSVTQANNFWNSQKSPNCL